MWMCMVCFSLHMFVHVWMCFLNMYFLSRTCADVYVHIYCSSCAHVCLFADVSVHVYLGIYVCVHIHKWVYASAPEKQTMNSCSSLPSRETLMMWVMPSRWSISQFFACILFPSQSLPLMTCMYIRPKIILCICLCPNLFLSKSWAWWAAGAKEAEK